MGKVGCEFRTTVVPSFVDGEDVIKIGELVKGVQTFVFQQFVPDDIMDKSLSVKPYSAENIAGFAEIMKKFTENTILRV